MARFNRALVLTLFILTPAIAMAKDDIDLGELSLEDLLNVEVTIASKSEETVADAPSSVTVFTRAEIQNMGILTLEDLLQYVPGFQSQLQISYGSSTTIQVRGKPENGYLSKDVLVLMDGVRLNDAFTGGSSMINRYTTLENIKQIEIIRGPGSALYGSNAYLGVINIVTVKDLKEAVARIGSFDEASMSANFYNKSGDWEFSGFVRAHKDEGDEHTIPVDFFGRSGTAKDPRQTTNVTARIKFKTFQFTYSNLDQALPDYMAGIALGGEGINGNNQKQDVYSASYDWKVNEKLDVAFSVARVEAKERMLWHWPEIQFTPESPKYFDFGLYLETYNDNLNIDINYAFNDKNSLSFGVSREIRGVTDNAIIANDGTKIIYLRGASGTTENVDQKVTALYVQDQHRFNDALKLILGVRHDDYNDTGSTTNPRAALIANTPWKGKIKLMYGQAFLAPTNSEQYQKNTLASNGNPNLKPETIETTELAYNQSWSKLNATITFYSSKISDKIELVPDVGSPNNNTIPINQGTVDLKGMEIEFQSSITKNFFLRGAYSKQFDDVDIWSAGETLALTANWSNKKFGVNLNGYYHSAVEKVADQGGTNLLNASLKWAFMSSMDLRFNVTNLTDELIHYGDAPFTDHLGEIQPNRGRAMELSSTYRF